MLSRRVYTHIRFVGQYNGRITTRTRDLWDPESSTSLDGFFKALADANRLRILNFLFHEELCGRDIQYVLEATQSNVSRHLTYLKNSGLVLDRRHGYRVY
ncbi:MAG: ArsR/SmtB family transcription factor [Terriglobales bacterium]